DLAHHRAHWARPRRHAVRRRAHQVGDRGFGEDQRIRTTRMSARARKRSTRGFSLVEVLVSIVVMSTGVLLLAGGSIFITRNLAQARLNTVAGAMVQAKADELRAVAAVGAPACLS